jgi:hypothetical protein
MASAPIRILLQTTLPSTDDDWSIDRFSLLRNYLASLTSDNGKPLCRVTARDRAADASGNDPVLSQLDRSEFDELWLFALDVDKPLGDKDVAGILRFHQQGGGIFTTRDHQDMGSSMSVLGPIAKFHYFNSRNPDPDPSRCCIDDTETSTISWPNYHSGRNGDYQVITPLKPIHELLLNRQAANGVIRFFPAHPHEGGVGVAEDDPNARIIATGKSLVTGRSFNLVVVDDPRHTVGAAKSLSPAGRIVAQSTFHHLVDYNWDVDKGCPSFVNEPPGDGYKREPEKLEDIKAYVRNLVDWLAPIDKLQ